MTLEHIDKLRNRYIYRGIRDGFNLCCILFFSDTYSYDPSKWKYYTPTMNTLTDNQGLILCPDCLARKLKIK